MGRRRAPPPCLSLCCRCAGAWISPPPFYLEDQASAEVGKKKVLGETSECGDKRGEKERRRTWSYNVKLPPPPHTITTTGPPSKVFLYATHLQNSDKIIILSAYILLRFPLRLHRVISMSEVPVSGEQAWFLPPLFPSNVPLMNALFAPGAHDSTDRKDVCPK